MKQNLRSLKIIIALLVGGYCLGSQDNSEKTSLTAALSNAYFPKESLMCLGAAADDQTRDNLRQTCKLFHQELSIKSFKKLLDFPLLNSLKLGYFACDAAWQRDGDLLKKRR